MGTGWRSVGEASGRTIRRHASTDKTCSEKAIRASTMTCLALNYFVDPLGFIPHVANMTSVHLICWLLPLSSTAYVLNLFCLVLVSQYQLDIDALW